MAARMDVEEREKVRKKTKANCEMSNKFVCPIRKTRTQTTLTEMESRVKIKVVENSEIISRQKFGRREPMNSSFA